MIKIRPAEDPEASSCADITKEYIDYRQIPTCQNEPYAREPGVQLPAMIYINN